MGIALMFGMLVTPYAEDAFAYMKEHTALALGIVAVLIVAIVMATKRLGFSTGARWRRARATLESCQVNYLWTRTTRQSLHLATSYERYSAQAWRKDPATLYRCKSSFYTAFAFFDLIFDCVKTRPCS
ncbi:unnamed protein product [Symbiodinium necroappetens]|uniref:Uncharacterized protein n=1 Tax=Symbiodinium necroappetens TaxID=1628268 RepID=A0A812VP36_9DINO|nr:unnamed protein product [Symbiodinium necroappetens]